MSTQSQFETDIIPTAAGDLTITFLGHASLMLAFADNIIYVDPFSGVADYSKLPDADIVLVTHDHHDHLDPQALAEIQTDKTEIVLTETCSEQVQGGNVLRNGDVHIVKGMQIEAVPAYNIVHKRENGQPFHRPRIGNGYIVNFGDKRVYIAGDTENIPEMSQLQSIDCAFLPMNVPYTMTPEMVAKAVKAFRPKIVYPYHCGDTNTARLVALLKDETDIEVRIRKMA